MYLRHSCNKLFIKIILLILGMVCLSSCMMVAGRGIRQGYDELLAISAINKLTEQHVYIDFSQVFPSTYRFEQSKERMFEKIISILKSQGETILKQDSKNGIIFTAAKEAPVPDRSGDIDDQGRIFYQQSIYVTSKSNKVTYVTSYPTVLKGDFQEIIIPLARNFLRGVFFGSLAAELYPAEKRLGLIAARERGKPEPKHYHQKTSEETVVHQVAVGETLGKISKQYTGNVMNYKKIAEYNGIDDVTKIKVGQKIKIPRDL